MTNFIPPYTITDKSITVMVKGKTLVLSQGEDRYDEVREAIRERDFDRVLRLLDVKGTLVSESNGGLYLMNGMLYCDKYSIPALLATRIIRLFREGFGVEHLSLFLENLMSNPSESSREELYGFIEACNLPITADGHFLAYKMVSKDFKDIYTGTMDNSIGAVVEMPRGEVNPDRNQTCSRGLHFCSEGYLGSYASRDRAQVVIVKVNPRDVVSIPTDYNNAKGRACRYEIVDTIDWDDRIKPYFTDQYSTLETENEADDAPDFELEPDSGYTCRWGVFNDEGNYVEAFDSRSEARAYSRRNPDCFVWDHKLNEVDRGVSNLPYPGWTPEAEKDEVPTVPGAKLNQQIADEIRALFDNGYTGTLVELANRYGVSERTIRRIRDYEAWVLTPDDWD